MRGGTSKAAFFHAQDLPAEPAARDAQILAAMGHAEPRQIDGIGGGHPLTTKVAIVSPSADPRADVDYLFGQVVATESRIDYAPTCGNILSGVGPFALDEGLVPAQLGQSVVRIRMVNTDSYCDAVVQTPGGRVRYSGDTAISGVPGHGAPVELRFSDILGSSCGALLPTGEARERIDGVEVTCIDNGMPVVLMRAADLGATGSETPAELDADAALKARIESIRLQAGQRMGLGDVSAKVVPKMTLVSRRWRRHAEHAHLHSAQVPRRHRRAGRGVGGLGVRGAGHRDAGAVRHRDRPGAAPARPVGGTPDRRIHRAPADGRHRPRHCRRRAAAHRTAAFSRPCAGAFS
jgi:4-oxalomesaconate tautomerase